MSKKLSKATKNMIAGKQRYRCANKPGIQLKGLADYECPLWKNKNIDLRGCFNEAGYVIDHIYGYSTPKHGDENNLQALCPMCHSVKTKRFLMNQNADRNDPEYNDDDDDDDDDENNNDDYDDDDDDDDDDENNNDDDNDDDDDDSDNDDDDDDDDDSDDSDDDSDDDDSDNNSAHNYKCKKCGVKFNKKSTFDDHLRKKTSCKRKVDSSIKCKDSLNKYTKSRHTNITNTNGIVIGDKNNNNVINNYIINQHISLPSGTYQIDPSTIEKIAIFFSELNQQQKTAMANTRVKPITPEDNTINILKDGVTIEDVDNYLKKSNERIVNLRQMCYQLLNLIDDKIDDENKKLVTNYIETIDDVKIINIVIDTLSTNYFFGDDMTFELLMGRIKLYHEMNNFIV
jgi:hypothetical protein